jgi:hypothetical protein
MQVRLELLVGLKMGKGSKNKMTGHVKGMQEPTVRVLMSKLG